MISALDQCDANAQPATGTNAPLVWILLGNRQGDNNQLLALARALNLPFKAKRLTYNQLRRLRFLRGPRLISLTADARRLIKPPWPDLVIGIGYGTVPVARYIRERTGGRAKIVQIGNPRSRISDLDLVITTPQYSRPAAPNVLALPFPIGNPAQSARPDSSEEKWLRAYPRPRRLIAVGGPANNWRLNWAALKRAIQVQLDKGAHDGGSVIVVSSARTPDAIKLLISKLLAQPRAALVESFPRYGVLLAQADVILVTADSVSMLSEAVLTGKPVGIIPVARSARGLASMVLRELPWSRPPFPDMPKFWQYLAQHRLVGSAEEPVASGASDTVSTAVAAVRRLLSEPSSRPR